jgi:hypothetical protein
VPSELYGSSADHGDGSDHPQPCYPGGVWSSSDRDSPGRSDDHINIDRDHSEHDDRNDLDAVDDEDAYAGLPDEVRQRIEEEDKLRDQMRDGVGGLDNSDDEEDPEVAAYYAELERRVAAAEEGLPTRAEAWAAAWGDDPDFYDEDGLGADNTGPHADFSEHDPRLSMGESRWRVPSDATTGLGAAFTASGLGDAAGYVAPGSAHAMGYIGNAVAIGAASIAWAREKRKAKDAHRPGD